jgi:multicomponent Na+:H+ antiporter subunit D
MEIISILPFIGIAVAGLTSLAIAIWGKKVNYRNIFSIAGSVVVFISVVAMIPATLKGTIYTFTVVKFLPGISVSFRADSLALLFAIVISSMWIIVNIYSIGYMSAEKQTRRFFTFSSLAVFSALGIAFSANLINFFIFYEMLTLSAYPLVIHDQSRKAYRAGTKYLIYSLTAGGFLLVGIIIVYFLTGSLSLAQAGILANAKASPAFLRTLFFIFLLGFGVKASIMPLHNWLPNSMVAPPPANVLLDAVTTVNAGVFGILRLLYCVYGPDLVTKLNLGVALAWIASFTVIAGSLVALKQDDLRQRLAYSTISQMSLIVLGAALLTPFSLMGSMIHIANHAFTKGAMFMCAGVILQQTGKSKISEMTGLAKRLPVTMAAFSIGALGMMGVPPVAGFVSKWFIAGGAAEGQRSIFIAIIIANAAIEAAYYLPIIYIAYLKKPENSYSVKQIKPSFYLINPIVIATSMTFILGIFAGFTGLPLSIAKVASKFYFKT